MTERVITTGQANAAQIIEHLILCDAAFTPALSSRVNIAAYGDKLARLALCIEAWQSTTLAGLLCLYCNDPKQGAFITNISVLPVFQGIGIAEQLLFQAIAEVQQIGFTRIKLEVDNANVRAQRLYKKFGFFASQVTPQSMMMTLIL
ncbi:GNAT family N-acetyltransferase [Enterobacter sp.]|uniref:GNAT family N-acetyltransferase n=1 Tax=Enterobacter sp. TaxID=42895 RepID=UPI00296F52A1|nr:GNAT family N-acetyltransferase [Enterobacter sp.]